MTALFALQPVRFRVARPDSKKNNMEIRRYGKFLKTVPSDTVVAQAEAISLHLYDLLGGRTHFGDHDVRVVVTHHARADELDVIVEDLGPRPKGFTGRKRDLPNVIDTLMDAMQGPVYANDNQICEVQLVRRLT